MSTVDKAKLGNKCEINKISGEKLLEGVEKYYIHIFYGAGRVGERVFRFKTIIKEIIDSNNKIYSY